MLKIKNKLLVILIIAFLAKSIIWLFYIPIFQSPDEHSHFAYIQRLSQSGWFNPRKDSLVSLELVKVAQILKFNWGDYHPVWQKPDSGWQEKIVAISPEDKTIFLPDKLFSGQRAAKNPPLYYYLATPFYQFFTGSNFLVRFYALRIYSLLLSLLTTYLVYKASLVFFKNNLLAVAVAFLVAFQPMFSAIGVAISSDNLAILLSACFFAASLEFIKSGQKKYIYLAMISLFLGILVKPSMLVFFVCFGLLFAKKISGLLFGLAVIFLIGLASFTLIDSGHDYWRYLLAFSDYKDSFNFIFQGDFSGFHQYFSDNRLTYLDNLFPWYWGVFGWLEATMPMSVYKLIKIVCGISIVGFFLWLVRVKKSKAAKKQITFLLFSAFLYTLALVFIDFRSWVNEGIAFGIQGRYFLPLILPFSLFFLLGVRTLAGKYYRQAVFLTIFLSLALNLIGFLTMYNYFYG